MARKRTIEASAAAAVVGPVEPGCEIIGLTEGRFSMVELVDYLLDVVVGPADVTISTWTVGRADLHHTHGMACDGRIRSCRWLVDFSFPSRQWGYCKELRERFGGEAIAATACHAKFVLIRNERWNLVVRSSANYNHNRRQETFEISDDAELADWYASIVESVFVEVGTIAVAAQSPTLAQDAVMGVCGELRAASGQIIHGAQGHVRHSADGLRGRARYG